MRRHYITSLGIFVVCFFIYFAFATHFTFHPKWALDYFNPLADSLIHGRLNLLSPQSTYDLIFFHDKWYAPWGILSSFFLIPFQLEKGRYIPLIYETITFACLNIVVVYFLLVRVAKDFFPNFSKKAIFLFLILFSFGTTQFYVGTLGSVWHVDQMVTSLFPTIGIYLIFKKKRSYRDYFLSTFFCAFSILGKPSSILTAFLPFSLFLFDVFLEKKLSIRYILGKTGAALLIFGIPFIVFSSYFFIYNYIRFGSITEYGYKYIHEAPYLAQIREKNGSFSLMNIPTNIRYMVFEIPRISLSNGVHFVFNPVGNSIFFLTPPFLAAFLAFPLVRKNKKRIFDPYISSLWIATIATITPILLLYSTGWVQFGYRYSLDIVVLLLLLVIFGIKGKVNFIFYCAVFFSIIMHIMGILSFM